MIEVKNITDAELAILTPWAKIQGKEIGNLIAENGKTSAIQNALQNFAQNSTAAGNVHPTILQTIAKDWSPVWNAVWTDFNSAEPKLVQIVADALTARLAPTAPAASK